MSRREATQCRGGVNCGDAAWGGGKGWHEDVIVHLRPSPRASHTSAGTKVRAHGISMAIWQAY